MRTAPPNAIKELVVKLPGSEHIREAYLLTLRLATPDIITQNLNGVETDFYATTREDIIMGYQLMGEQPVIERFVDSLRPDDVVWDVGAGIGTYACFAQNALGPDGTAIAFEPDLTRRHRCVANFELNADGTQTATYGNAFGRTSGDEVPLPVSGSASDGAVVEIVAGDDFADPTDPDRAPPNVLKVDIEGFEADALAGMDGLLRDSVRELFVEIHPDQLADLGGDPRQIEGTLREYGFDLKRFGERIVGTWCLHATR